tara:strand:- start:89 stop:898 length:810 start_codon:yes stop_codon:yes gene_type:complete
MEKLDLELLKKKVLIKIFDSLTHPTINGKWLKSDLDATFDSLANDMALNNISYVIASATTGHGYSHKGFIKKCSSYAGIIPIARLDVNNKNLNLELEEVKKLGYKGVKFHPRFENFNYSIEKLTEVFSICSKLKLTVHWCSFYYSKIENLPNEDPLFILIKALKSSPDLKLVIVHGGVHDLMKYAELARFNSNILIDLSYTLLQYKNTSLFKDILFLFEKLDRRLCIGSDHPEFSLKELRETFDEIYKTQNISKEKLENIAYKNLLNLY